MRKKMSDEFEEESIDPQPAVVEKPDVDEELE
jgi:hypothetical protein